MRDPFGVSQDIHNRILTCARNLKLSKEGNNSEDRKRHVGFKGGGWSPCKCVLAVFNHGDAIFFSL